MKLRTVKAAIVGVIGFVSLVCGLALAACNKNASSVLPAPENLRIEDDYLVWDEVNGATFYTVEINGDEYTTQTNRLDLLEITDHPATYTMKTLAEGNSLAEYSDWSDEIEYKVEAAKNLEYHLLDGGTYEVSAIFDEAARKEITGKLIIPSVTDEGRPITAIGANGFTQCRNITSVYVPDGIDTVGNAAFQRCTSATRVRLPEGLQSISDFLFNNCLQLKEISVPVGVTTIGVGAFGACTSLEKLDLPDGLTLVKASAFKECRSLKSLILPDSFVRKIGSVFQDCDSLTRLEIKGGESENYKSDGNCIISKFDNALMFGCAGSIIPDYVTKIYDNAFLRCGGLTEIEIPSSVKKIGKSAFGYCVNLRTVSFPEGLTAVSYMAFNNCSKLESVYISSTVREWSVDSVDYESFSNVFPQCPSLKNITVSEDNPVFKSDANCIIKRDNNELVEGCAGSVIPSYITRIGNFAFSGCEVLTEITVPYGVREIGREAFFCCHNVREVYLPESVTRIEEYAFDECCFASVTIPESVTNIGSGALSDGAYAVFKGGTTGFVLPEGIYDSRYVPECVLGYDGDYPYVYSAKAIYGHYLGKDTLKYILGVIAPVRKGYTFLGWTTQEGGTQAEISAVTTVLEHKFVMGRPKGLPGEYIEHYHNITVALCPDEYFKAEDITFYAVWQKNN